MVWDLTLCHDVLCRWVMGIVAVLSGGVLGGIVMDCSTLLGCVADFTGEDFWGNLENNRNRSCI